MFVFSFKVTKKKIAVLCCAVAVIIGATVLSVLASDRNDHTSNVAGTEKKVSLLAKTNEQRCEFIESFGWEINREPYEVAEVTIPEEFDDVYLNYNSLQTTQGFNLEKYKGKRVKRWTYPIQNYPEHTDVVANILVYNDKIIGGDVCSPNLSGFMHGFDMKQAVSKEN